jgi:hypothetical protein
MFLFGKSKHQIPISQNKYTQNSGAAINTTTRMKYTVC